MLIEKLKIFPDEIAARERIARAIPAALADVATVPRVAEGSTSVWAQYTIRLPAGRRDALAAALKAQGIPTAIYYAKPVHQQDAYRAFPVAEGGMPVSERLAARGDQPADARLSRRADAGPHHRRRAARAVRIDAADGVDLIPRHGRTCSGHPRSLLCA